LKQEQLVYIELRNEENSISGKFGWCF